MGIMPDGIRRLYVIIHISSVLTVVILKYCEHSNWCMENTQ